MSSRRLEDSRGASAYDVERKAAPVLVAAFFSTFALFAGEIGVDDFRISKVGIDGDPTQVALQAAVAHNAARAPVSGVQRHPRALPRLVECRTGNRVG